MADLTPDIETNAAGLKRATVDGNSAENHSIPDQIAADRYLQSQTARSGKRPGIRLFQLRSRGTV